MADEDVMKVLVSIQSGMAKIDGKVEALGQNVTTGYQELSRQVSTLSDRVEIIERATFGSTPPPDGSKPIDDQLGETRGRMETNEHDVDALKAQVIQLNGKVDKLVTHAGLNAGSIWAFLQSTEGKKFLVAVGTAIGVIYGVVRTYMVK